MSDPFNFPNIEKHLGFKIRCGELRDHYNTILEKHVGACPKFTCKEIALDPEKEIPAKQKLKSCFE